MSGFNARQTAQLLKPIAAQRVLRDGKGNSHVSQQDITAHLIRVFGFGSYDTELLSIECVFESPRMDKDNLTGRWDVCYRAVMRLTIRDEHGDRVCSFEDGATHTAQNQTRGDAHDLAFKSAISLSIKRCAKNLGDQFGLSLYNKGQTAPLVIATLIEPADQIYATRRGTPATDVQEGVAEQLTLGNDETETGDAA